MANQQQATQNTEEVKKDELFVDPTGSLHFFYDVELQISVELGRAECTLERLLKLKKGSVIELNKLPEEPLDIRVNNKLLAQGEAVVVNDKFGVRVTQIVSSEGELDTISSQNN